MFSTMGNKIYHHGCAEDAITFVKGGICNVIHIVNMTFSNVDPNYAYFTLLTGI